MQNKVKKLTFMFNLNFHSE